MRPGVRLVLLAEAVRNILHISGSKGLLLDHGNGALTNGRTSTATFVDHEGVVRTAKANEIRYSGGRRVENLVSNSNDLTSWVYFNGASAATSTTFNTGSSGNPYLRPNHVLGRGTRVGEKVTVRFRMSVSSTSGYTTFRIAADETGGTVVFTNITASTTPTIYSKTFTLVGDGTDLAIRFQFLSVTTNTVVSLTNVQVELVTGQSNTSPSAYIDSITTYNAGVAGVHYFDYANGNTVDGNGVVTEANGAAFATKPTILHEGARTNLALHCRDFTNIAWVKVTMTASKDAVGVGGVANAASTLTATASNATALQTITSASAQRITGCYIKRKTGAGVVELTQNAGITWTPVTVTANWTLVTIPAVTSSNPTFGLRLVTNGDAVYVDMFQHELGAYSTSSIETTTAAVTRATDSIKLPLVLGKNFRQGKGVLLFRYRPQHTPEATLRALFGIGGTGVLSQRATINQHTTNDGTTESTVDLAWAVNDDLLLAVLWDSKSASKVVGISKNGAAWQWGTVGSYDGDYGAGSNIELFLSNGLRQQLQAAKLYNGLPGRTLANAQTWVQANAAAETV